MPAKHIPSQPALWSYDIHEDPAALVFGSGVITLCLRFVALMRSAWREITPGEAAVCRGRRPYSNPKLVPGIVYDKGFLHFGGGGLRRWEPLDGQFFPSLQPS